MNWGEIKWLEAVKEKAKSLSWIFNCSRFSGFSEGRLSDRYCHWVAGCEFFERRADSQEIPGTGLQGTNSSKHPLYRDRLEVVSPLKNILSQWALTMWT